MPISTTSLAFSVTVSNVTNKSFQADVRANVKKRIADILYLASPPDDAVRLEYVGSKEITSSEALFIGDRSDRLYQNTDVKEGRELVVEGNSTGVQHKKLLATQKFKERAGEKRPLYFKHMLPAQIDLDSVTVFDKNLEEVGEEHYSVELIEEYDESTGQPVVPSSYLYVYVFNDLESWFDENTGEYEVFYAQYMDSDNVVKIELLDNEPAYTEATIDDIWYVTNELKPWCHAYILSPSYILQMPSTPDAEYLAIKYLARSKIEVRPPALYDDTSLWFPRVTNGSFKDYYGGWAYHYEISEFGDQAFNPYEPYKMTDRSLGTKVEKNILKLPHENLYSEGFARALSIVIENNGVVIKALTQDTSLIGENYTTFDGEYVKDEDGDYIKWSSDEILSIDTWGGFVNLDFVLKDYWDCWCSYTYEEELFEVSSLNMNPIFDSETHKQTRALYVVPKSGPNGNTAQTRAVQYLKVSPGGVIEETSQDGSGNNNDITGATQIGDANGYSIINAEGLHYNWRAETDIQASFQCAPGTAVAVANTDKFPRSGWIRFLDNNDYWVYAKYTSKTNTTLVFSSESGETPDSAPVVTFGTPSSVALQLVNFVDQYTTSSYFSSTSEEDHFGLTSGFPNCYSRCLLLADLSINPPLGIHDLARIDVREEGGGVIPGKYDEAKLLNPEVQWYQDFLRYDGQPTPGNAAVVMKLPAKLLDVFSKEKIEEIVDENIPYGVKPLIRYYGYKPEILSISTTSEGLLVCWEPMGPEFTYGVWYASKPGGPWTRHNEVRLTDNSLGRSYVKNCYLVDGLPPGEVYYVKVTCLDRYGMWQCSYSDYDSVEGGEDRVDDAPEYPFGNSASFEITVQSSGFGEGAFGEDEFGG